MRIPDRGRFLTDLAAEFSRQPDLGALCQTVARRVADALGDWCAVTIVDPAGPHLMLAAVYHRDPAKVQQIRDVLGQFLIARDDPLVRHVLGAHRPVVLSFEGPHLRDPLARMTALAEAFARLGIARAVEVPMYARGDALGLLGFGADTPGHWDEDDLRLASLVADLAAIAIQNARLREAEQTARRAAERAADRTARLQAVTAALSEAVRSSHVLDAVLEHGTAALDASFGFVALLVADGTSLEIVRARGYPGASESLGARRPMSASLPSTEAVRTGKPIYLRSREEGLSRYPGLATFRSGLPDGARVALPLAAGGPPAGALVFVFPGPRVFEEGDRALMLAFARQCTIALERARLYERERRVADTLQRAFLPEALPDLPGFAIHAAYQPAARDAEVGGDWYDAFRLPDGQVVLSVGDVVGRGLQAAVVMGQVRQTIRAAALLGHPPAEVLGQASRVLRLTYMTDGMATALVGVLDPIASTLAYASAGHPGPVLGTPDGSVEVLPSGGLPLGALGSDLPEPRVVTLPPGSLLVLYTDGLVEATRDVAAGEAVLTAAVREELAHPSGTAAQAILARVLGGASTPDDVALITVSVAPAPLDRLDLTLPAEPASLPLIRHALLRMSAALRLEDDERLALTVAVGEAVNNAVEHAYGARSGTVSVRARRDGPALRVEVQDRGRWQTAHTQERGGMGLALMRALVDAVEIDSTAAGTTVRLLARPSSMSSQAAAPILAEVQPARVVRALERTVPGVPHGSPEDTRHEALRRRPGCVEVRQVHGVSVVECAGDLDLANAHVFRRALEDAAASHPVVVVSLGSVSYLDSHAVHVLLTFGRRLATARGTLRLVVSRTSAVRRIVEAAGLGRAFAILDSVDEATAAAPAARAGAEPRSPGRDAG